MNYNKFWSPDQAINAEPDPKSYAHKKYRNNLLWHNVPLLYVFACSTQTSSNQLKPAQNQQCLLFKNDYLFWELSRVTLCKMSGKINNAHLPSIDEYRTYLRVMIEVEDPLN
jgi:hypothetical protein